jgi:RNA polymerase sigma-70 factor (ECF subfamily)
VIENYRFDDLVAGAQLGESWAITVLYREFQPRLLRYLRSREREDADDLASEVWLAVARNIGRFDGDEAGFRAWLFTIARRQISDHRRRRTRRRTDPVDEGGFSTFASPSSPETEVVDELSAQFVVDLVGDLLSEEQAEVVLLRVLGGLDAKQVGEIMGHNESWVRVNQHRALARLADHLRAKLGVTP